MIFSLRDFIANACVSSLLCHSSQQLNQSQLAWGELLYLRDSACAVRASCQLVWAIGEHMAGKVLLELYVVSRSQWKALLLVATGC